MCTASPCTSPPPTCMDALGRIGFHVCSIGGFEMIHTTCSGTHGCCTNKGAHNIWHIIVNKCGDQIFGISQVITFEKSSELSGTLCEKSVSSRTSDVDQFDSINQKDITSLPLHHILTGSTILPSHADIK